MRRKNVELWMPKSLLEVLVDVQLQVKVSEGAGTPSQEAKGRTIRKLMGGGGGRSTKKKFAQGKIK